jgi:hypothetical protein
MAKKRKKASEIFGPVDPNLKVIDGGKHHRHQCQNNHLSQDDWENAKGVNCKICGQESFRLKDGICIHCLEKKELQDIEEMGRKQTKRYLIRALQAGQITVSDAKAGRLHRK